MEFYNKFMKYLEDEDKEKADFYTLNGFDTVFVGANTPKEDFVSAINIIKPKYVVISVTNYYNIVNAERADRIVEIKDGKVHMDIVR